MPLSLSRVAAETLKVLPRKELSRAVGQLADVSRAKPIVDAAVDLYVRAYGVDLSDAVVPDGGFPTFDAFFTRKLRPGARPLDPDPRALLSPADGKLEDAGPIDRASSFLVKGDRYTVGQLLGDESAADRYVGGYFAIIYLSPRDYHRVHAPVAGPVRRTRHVPGTLLPVNAIGLAHFPGLFGRNERVVVEQDGGDFGVVTTVMVGAIGVGRITLAFSGVETNRRRDFGLHTYGEDAPKLGRGDELGTFHLGSTAVVFVEGRSGVRPCVVQGEAVRMGVAIGRRVVE